MIILSRLFAHLSPAQFSFSWIWLIAGLALVPAVLRAEVLTFRFSGTANTVGAPLSSYFSVGNPFSFTVSYDTTATGTYSGDTSRTFSALSAVLTVNATGGDWTTVFTNPTIQVDDSPSFNRITFTAGMPPFTASERFSNHQVGGRELSAADFRLYADAPGPLTTFLALPTGFDLSEWSSHPSSSGAFTYWIPGGGTDFMRFSVSGVENLSAIPEPSTYAGAAGALALAAGLWRRRVLSRKAD